MPSRIAAIRVALDAMYFTGTHIASRPLLGGIGAILMFHRVRPALPHAFQPNRFLEITPEFLDEVIAGVRSRGFEIVSMNEAMTRLASGRRDGPRFVVLTFDDATRDTLDHAWPVLEQARAPFTMYVASSFASGTGSLWWMAVEDAIRDNDTIHLDFGTDTFHARTATLTEKHDAYAAIVDAITETPGVSTHVMRSLDRNYGIDAHAQCRAECLEWEELRFMAKQDLVTIGAHTVSHPILTHLDETALTHELTASRDTIERELGIRPAHLAFPHGGPREARPREFAAARDVGYASAVTTRTDVVRPGHASCRNELPRITVNGLFQHMRYLDVLLSGAPGALYKAISR